ncbi:MAG: glycosylase [Planctomycetota bacterium]|nr:glycosylase [Planctomycetota bacterium]
MLTRNVRRLAFFAGCLSVVCSVPLVFAADNDFPAELVTFEPIDENPIFVAEGEGHWDVKIRERGFILKNDECYMMWYTGYDGTREGQKMLGLATSGDGIHWTQSVDNPIYDDHWVEDMMVVKVDDVFYMFAEGEKDQAQLLTSDDGVNWQRQGTLDVRLKNGEPIPPGPYGTPTAWHEEGTWYLFYERRDAGVWLATSSDMKVWTNRQDEPVLLPGPDDYDRDLIALNQIVKYNGRYYAYYHGASNAQKPNLWTTNVAVSDDLIHWKKYAGNPLFPISANKSSGIVVPDGDRFRLYTMHNEVHVHFPVREK